jgi:hypothetical protein
VQIGIGGWQPPRPGVKAGRERQPTIMTIIDCVEMAGVIMDVLACQVRSGHLPNR